MLEVCVLKPPLIDWSWLWWLLISATLKFVDLYLTLVNCCMACFVIVHCISKNDPLCNLQYLELQLNLKYSILISLTTAVSACIVSHLTLVMFLHYLRILLSGLLLPAHLSVCHAGLSNYLQQPVNWSLIPLFAKKFFCQLSNSASFEEMEILNQNLMFITQHRMCHRNYDVWHTSFPV